MPTFLEGCAAPMLHFAPTGPLCYWKFAIGYDANPRVPSTCIVIPMKFAKLNLLLDTRNPKLDHILLLPRPVASPHQASQLVSSVPWVRGRSPSALCPPCPSSVLLWVTSPDPAMHFPVLMAIICFLWPPWPRACGKKHPLQRQVRVCLMNKLSSCP